MASDFTERRLSGETLYEGKIVTLRLDRVTLSDGKPRTREVVQHPGGVTVAALTADNRLLFVRQYRYAVGEHTLELPAGKLEPGEDPFEAMRREQLEETGTTSECYVSLGKMFATPGYCSEILYLWACRISEYGEQHLDDGELLDVEAIPLDEAEQMVMEGRIPDGKTQVGVLKTAALVRAGKL